MAFFSLHVSSPQDVEAEADYVQLRCLVRHPQSVFHGEGYHPLVQVLALPEFHALDQGRVHKFHEQELNEKEYPPNVH